MPETSEVVSVKEGIQVCGWHEALLVCMREGTRVRVYGCEGRGMPWCMSEAASGITERWNDFADVWEFCPFYPFLGNLLGASLHVFLHFLCCVSTACLRFLSALKTSNSALHLLIGPPSHPEGWAEVGGGLLRTSLFDIIRHPAVLSESFWQVPNSATSNLNL